MKINSKKKGNNYERNIAKFLSKTTNSDFRRVPQSGAYFTGTKVDFPQFVGDVYTTDKKLQNIIIECKKYKSSVRLHDLFNPKSDIGRAMTQAMTQSQGKSWILFFKADRCPTIVISSEETLNMLNIFSESALMFNDLKILILDV